MKVINYIKLVDLFSHTNTHIDFTEGKNYIVGSIGKGKTLVLEGIGFALFGSVALRGKATMYKKSYVELSFNYKNETFVVKRKVNDASLYILNKDTNEYDLITTSTTSVNQHIINLLGYTYDVYLLSNYCKQKKLSHFSELTPANRHSYIDKISGLNEAKTLTAFIDAQRKSISANINLLKDMITKPILPEGLDLEFDYVSNLKVLDGRFESISTLYDQYNAVTAKINSMHIVEPKLVLTPLESSIQRSNKPIDDVISILSSVSEKEVEYRSLKDEFNKLPSINNKYKDINIDQINSEIHKHNMQFVDYLPDGFSVSCSCCNSDIVLSEVLDKDNNEKPTIPLNILYSLQEYLNNDIKGVKKTLQRQLDSLDKGINLLLDSIPEFNLSSISDITTAVDTLDTKISEYDKELLSYNTNKDLYDSLNIEAKSIKEEIDNFLLNQKELLNTKDLYTTLQTKKVYYLQQLDIYETAIVKYTALKSELDLFVDLKKEISKIVLNIQNNIIPLIDYHASVFIDLITKGSMSKIEVTENYDILIDGVSISLRSGGQQDLASLAFRLSLGQSVVTGMLPLFIGDEIDSAGTSEVSDDITLALDSISNSGFQVILITHQDISTIENANIIQL